MPINAVRASSCQIVMAGKQFDPLQRKSQRSTLWADSALSLETKLRLSFAIYIEGRISPLPEPQKRVIREILANVGKNRDLNNARYDELLRKIVVDRRMVDSGILYYDVLSHEIEHAIQALGRSRLHLVIEKIVRMLAPTPAISNNTVHIEREAIGAEWDFLQSIPQSARQEALDRIRDIENLESKFFNHLKSTVEAAELPREVFIRHITHEAGYTRERLIIPEYTTKIMFYGLMALIADDLVSGDPQ